MRSEQRFSTYLYCSCGACWSGGVWGFQRRGSPRLYARRGGRASVHWLRETAARGRGGGFLLAFGGGSLSFLASHCSSSSSSSSSSSAPFRHSSSASVLIRYSSPRQLLVSYQGTISSSQSPLFHASSNRPRLFLLHPKPQDTHGAPLD